MHSSYTAVYNIHNHNYNTSYHTSHASWWQHRPSAGTMLMMKFSSGSWWRHQMETLYALLALCAGNSPVTSEFPSQRPVTRSFGVFFDLRLNKRLSKQSWGRWFETPWRSLWRHCNVRSRLLRNSMLQSMLVDNNFRILLLIGWQHSRQPVKNHVRKSFSINMDFNMDFFSVIQAPCFFWIEVIPCHLCWPGPIPTYGWRITQSLLENGHRGPLHERFYHCYSN